MTSLGILQEQFSRSIRVIGCYEETAPVEFMLMKAVDMDARVFASHCMCFTNTSYSGRSEI